MRNNLIWQYEVEFERFARNTVTYKCYVRYAHILYDFLKANPEATKPEDILITDVEDWYIKRSRETSLATARYEIGVIRYFYNWLRAEKGLEIKNPAANRRHPKLQPQPFYLEAEGLLEVRRQATQNPRESTILELVQADTQPGEICRVLGLSATTVRRHWVQLLNRSGVSYLPLKSFYASYEQLCRRVGEQALLTNLPLAALDSDKPASTESTGL